jgi:hypothetical protein
MNSYGMWRKADFCLLRDESADPLDVLSAINLDDLSGYMPGFFSA